MQNVIALVVIVITIVMMVKEKQKLPKDQIVQDQLSRKQKISIWILCLLNPILAGAIFYYGWKKQLPIKAKQANKISLLAFLLEIMLIITLAIVLPPNYGY